LVCLSTWSPILSSRSAIHCLVCKLQNGSYTAGADDRNYTEDFYPEEAGITSANSYTTQLRHIAEQSTRNEDIPEAMALKRQYFLPKGLISARLPQYGTCSMSTFQGPHFCSICNTPSSGDLQTISTTLAIHKEKYFAAAACIRQVAVSVCSPATQICNSRVTVASGFTRDTDLTSRSKHYVRSSGKPTHYKTYSGRSTG